MDGGKLVRKSLVIIFVLVVSQSAFAFERLTVSDSSEFSAAFNNFPHNNSATQRRRGDFGRRRHRGIGHAYAASGRSVARGSRRFARHMRHGRPLHAGAAFGRGMGGFGKHFGKGTARVGKRVAGH